LVIAFCRGSVPEVIDGGVTGFIVDDIEGSLQALDKLRHFDRERCRKVFVCFQEPLWLFLAFFDMLPFSLSTMRKSHKKNETCHASVG
jgi:hypothetical protein